MRFSPDLLSRTEKMISVIWGFPLIKNESSILVNANLVGMKDCEFL